MQEAILSPNNWTSGSDNGNGLSFCLFRLLYPPNRFRCKLVTMVLRSISNVFRQTLRQPTDFAILSDANFTCGVLLEKGSGFGGAESAFSMCCSIFCLSQAVTSATERKKTRIFRQEIKLPSCDQRAIHHSTRRRWHHSGTRFVA